MEEFLPGGQDFFEYLLKKRTVNKGLSLPWPQNKLKR